MEDLDASKGLTSSWEDVYKMPYQADAAQEDCEQRQAVSKADAPKKHQAGAPEAEAHSKKSTAAGENDEWILEDQASSDKKCFEGEAEVVQASQKDTSLHFEEEGTCVHPSKPNFDAEAAIDFDSASEGDLEASSLDGSDCEYAFVLDRPNVKPGDADKEAPGTPDKGRSMIQSLPSPPQSPLQWGPRRSSQLTGTPSLQAARSGSESPAQSPGLPSPAPPCTEAGQLEEGATMAEQGKLTADLPCPSAAAADEESAAGNGTVHCETHSPSATEGDRLDSSRTQAGLDQDGQEAMGCTAGLTNIKRDEVSCPHSLLGSLSDAPSVPVEMGCSPDLPSSLQSAAAEVAAQRRRQLDAVGVIPGGRAAFGAKLPTHEVSLESSRCAAAGRQQQHAAGRRAALPELARPAAPDWARPRGRTLGSLSAGASGPGTAAAVFLRRLQAHPGPAALDGRRVPAAARRMEVRALPGAMLECYDSLWHGSSGIVASQS